MKKVLFLIHDLSVGGAEKVLVNLVNHMNKEEFDITVMSLFDYGVNKQFLSSCIKYKYCFKKLFPANSHFLKLFTPEFLHAYFIKNQYDIEVSFLEGPTARIISGCKNKETKKVNWIHCTISDEKTLKKGFRSVKESKKCYEKFDQMLFVSSEVKAAFQKVCPKICDSKILFNVNDTDLIESQSEEKVDDVLFSSDYFTICGVGKLVENKNFERLIKIQQKLIKDGFKSQLIILGVGPLKEKLEQLSIDCGVNDSVKFLGYQTNPYKYVSKSDLFVCSSYSEGFSTAATEALIVGTPVCTVEVSGMREMLGENNEYGLIVENDDDALYRAIKELISDKALYSLYKEKAIERGKKFSTKETVKAVEEMLNSL